MKLKLKVLDSKLPKLTIKECIEKKIIIKDIDDRWNIEMEFEIPERLILSLIEEIIDKIMDQTELYHYEEREEIIADKTENVIDRIVDQTEVYHHEEGQKSSSLKRQIHVNEANNMIKSARSWKKIHILISDKGLQTSRFTRISLFDILLNIPEMTKRMNMKVHEIEQASLNQIKKIPKEKSQSELAPIVKVSETNFMEFTNKINSL